MVGTFNRTTVARSLAVAVIVVVIGGLFLQREVLSDDEPVAGAGSAGPQAVGLLDDRTLAVGEAAPDFLLETLSGETVRLSDLRGKTVVVNFWASWCPPCRQEMPEFQALFEERADDDDLTIIAIDFTPEDTRAAAQQFVTEQSLTFPIALDTESGAVAQRYGVRGLPATFFIDRDGVVRDQNLGPVFGDLLPEKVAAADAAGG